MIDTRQKIIDEGSHLIQTRGYHAFSFKDISHKVGIKTASIHYHFPTKSDLVKAIVISQREATATHLNQIISHPNLTEKEKIHTVCQGILENTYMTEQKMCLAGMLAIDVQTLQPEVAQEVRALLNLIEEKLYQIISNGIKTNEFRNNINAKSTAHVLIAMIEGTLLLTRLYQDKNRFTDVMEVITSRLL
ncbi:TetR/AcrR family transcriptional regulator [Gammaproteobacteria bacterium]|nr:TetR/AcrR family transcriptional regulator [Gammaproteobacteria bacterium]